MTNKISLEIVSPEKPVLKDDVDFIVIPAVDGEIGILPEHTHMLAELAVGEMRITKGGDVQLFAVSGGFAEVHPDRVAVFAETAEMAKEIDVERARLAAEKAKLALTRALNSQDMVNAQAALRRALMRLHVSGQGSIRRHKPR